ncbi:MAG TPA: tetratricopeptide repeat protein [Sedimentisphaerales bacterium]|nr:tetratricopeptide repeat protein [Sedimentisphaerales bacterium]
MNGRMGPDNKDGRRDTKAHRPAAFAVLSIAMAAAVLATYWPVLKYDFVKYDDDRYITDNRNITGGITPQSLIGAFTESHYYMWHPLTTLTQMLDCQLYGLSAGRHHLTSLLIHLANTLLLFWVLTKMTDAMWPSAFVAAVFGLHPLQVESVAWLSERKNVLSGLFWILTIGAYVRYASRPGLLRLLAVVLVFALCIMTKPMVVTLPCVLLLLDYWPLDRLRLKRKAEIQITPAQSQEDLPEIDAPNNSNQGTSLPLLILEKVPLFILTAVLSIITYNAQKSGGVVSALEKLTLKSRAANAVISYLTYIEKMFWPSGLAVFYPHPAGNFSRTKVVVSAALLVLLTIFFIYFGLRRKYLAVGWLWYVGTLVPVIGLVQVGAQARADRYMYITMIGLLVILAWGVKDLVAKWRHLRIAAVLAAAVVLPAAAVCTRLQLRHFKDSAALFKHALDVTTDNFVMENNYANLLSDTGRIEQAIEHYQKALKLRPRSAEVYTNLGNALMDLHKTDEAIEQYKKAVSLAPDLAVAHHNLARALAQSGANTEAVTEYREAVRLKPDYVEAWSNLGLELAQQGAHEEAVECYNKAIELEPDNIIAHGRLGLALASLGRDDQAIEQFQIVLKARPDDFEMYFNLGFLLERQGKTDEAIKEYRRALQINPDLTKARRQLEAALTKQKNP